MDDGQSTVGISSVGYLGRNRKNCPRMTPHQGSKDPSLEQTSEENWKGNRSSLTEQHNPAHPAPTQTTHCILHIASILVPTRTHRARRMERDITRKSKPKRERISSEAPETPLQYRPQEEAYRGAKCLGSETKITGPSKNGTKL